jgi:hypothetical protein
VDKKKSLTFFSTWGISFCISPPPTINEHSESKNVNVGDYFIRILYNYLFEFERIQAGDCETIYEIYQIKIKMYNYLSSQISLINNLSQLSIQILQNSNK